MCRRVNSKPKSECNSTHFSAPLGCSCPAGTGGSFVVGFIQSLGQLIPESEPNTTQLVTLLCSLKTCSSCWKTQTGSMPRSDSKEGRVAENSEFGNQRWVWRYRERISPQTAAVLVRFRRHLRRQPETAPLCTVRRGNAINGM